MDWLDLLAVHGTLKSLLQHHSSTASIFQRSAFFTVPLSLDMAFWKNESRLVDVIHYGNVAYITIYRLLIIYF